MNWPKEFRYWKPALCRVPKALPSVFFRALGKDGLCRVLNKIHSAKKNTRQNASLSSAFFWHSANMYFAECYFSAHDKVRLCRVPFFWHSAKMYFAECLCFGTQQRGILPCAFFLPSANQFFKAIFEALNEFK